MTDDMPNARFIVIAILIMFATAGILIRYARACLCDSCKDPYAIFGRGELQLCRQCKIVFDRCQLGNRRALLRHFRRNFNVNPFGTKYANRDDKP